MTLTQLEEQVSALKGYTKNAPEDIRNRYTVRTRPTGSIIHQKDIELGCFEIVVPDENRVTNELKNGNVCMIKDNKAIDFIGEVTILARVEWASVTIEAATDNVVAYINRRDAEHWLAEDMNVLCLIARHTASKLYRSSYNNRAKPFYPSSYLLLDYMVRYGGQNGMDSTHPPKAITVGRTRQMLQEEIGVNVKTPNRTVQQLKEEGFFDLCKGKPTFSEEQYRAAMGWLEAAKDK